MSTDVESTDKKLESKTMGLRQILLIAQGCDLPATANGRVFMEAIKRAFETKGQS